MKDSSGMAGEMELENSSYHHWRHMKEPSLEVLKMEEENSHLRLVTVMRVNTSWANFQVKAVTNGSMEQST